MENEQIKEINMEFTKKIIKNGNGICIFIPKDIVNLHDIKGGDVAEVTLKKITRK